MKKIQALSFFVVIEFSSIFPSLIAQQVTGWYYKETLLSSQYLGRCATPNHSFGGKKLCAAAFTVNTSLNTSLQFFHLNCSMAILQSYQEKGFTVLEMRPSKQNFWTLRRLALKHKKTLYEHNKVIKSQAYL